MSQHTNSEKSRWNQRYTQAPTPDVLAPPAALVEMAEHLPHTGDAVDLAGGLGDGALFLARRGLQTSLIEVSDVALSIAADRARAQRLELDLVESDLAVDGLPQGPWDAITCFHYLNRDVLASLMANLRPGGVALVGIATTTNLERHDRPSARFLLEPDELPALLVSANGRARILHHVEDWAPWGVHEARVAVRVHSDNAEVSC